ncbi:hypothetical protein O3P69_012776, partial [Scylla paramamosain]
YIREARALHPAMAFSNELEELFESRIKLATKELVTAVEKGDEAGVRLALERGARAEVTVPINDRVSGSLLTLAASEGHDHLLPHLLQAGLSIEGWGTTDATPLMLAALFGHSQTVKALLDLGSNPLATYGEGWTALHFAARSGHQQCVAALIPVTPPTPAHLQANTPVHTASYEGHVEVLEQLAGAGWSLTARNSDGDTPMHRAAAGGSVTCLQWLVQRGGDPSVQNNAGHTPLDQELVTAVEKGDETGVMLALYRGARPEVKVPTNDEMSWSLFTVAASEGHDHLLPYLLQAGLSIEDGGTTDMTPLMMAALRGHTQTVNTLLELGGNPLATHREGWTALHLAAGQGHQQCVAALIPVTPPTPAHLAALTPVHTASYNGHVEVLEQLAGAGWPLTSRDSYGNTPMHRAAAGGSVTCQRWLVQRGGDPSVQNNAGHTPLDQELVSAVEKGDEAWVRSALDRGARPKVTVPTNAGVLGSLLTVAVYEGHDHLLPSLLEAGISIEGEGTTDKTPLMVAALRGHTQTVKALLDRGSNPLATYGEGWTALHFAARSGHQQCVAALMPVTPPTPAHLKALTPVHTASSKGRVEVLEQLAGAGWPLTAWDSSGYTPMHHAVVGGSVAAVEWLVQRAGDPHIQSKDRRTPMELAMQYGCHEVETWLAKNGGGVGRSKILHVEEVRAWQGLHENQHNSVLSLLVAGNEAAMATIPRDYDGHALSHDGLTPLHAAALCGAPSGVVEALLRRGVSPHVTTPDNMTPADLARQQGHDSVIMGLQRHHCEQSGTPPEYLHEELLSTVSRRDDVQAVSALLCKGAPIELLGSHSVLRLAVTTDRTHIISLLLASGAPLPASLLQEAWQSPDVTHRVLAFLTTAYCCRLRAEQRRLEKISSALVEGIDSLVKTIEGNTPWQAAWRWGKETDRPALSDLLAKAAAANCPVTAAFLHRAGGWTVFNGASGGTALHAALEAGHKGMADLLIRDLGGCPYVPDTHGRLPVHMLPDEEQQRLEQKLFMEEREKLENMELRLKADHEKTAARTALCIQKDLFESHKKGEGLQELQMEAQRVAVDLSKDEALEVKEAVMAEAERWMPRHKKSFFKWFATREWNIAVPGGFCFKNALLRWLEHRRWRKVELGAGRKQDHNKELGAGQEGNHAKELGAGQEGDHNKELGAGQEGNHVKELGAGQEGDHTKELGTGQEGNHTKELGAGQKGDHAKKLGAEQEGDHTNEFGAGQEGDHTKEFGTGQEKDHATELGAAQEGDHTKELGAEQKGDHSKELGAGQEGDHTKELGAGQERNHAKELVPGREGDPTKWLGKVFRLMCANPEESREQLTTQNSSAYFGGDCEGRKPGDGAPVIVQCLEEGLEKLSSGLASAKTTRPRR